MIFLQRLVMICLFPLLALFATHAHSLDIVQPLQDAIESYISNTPLASLFSDPLPPRSEIPLIMTATTHWSHLEKIAIIAVELAELGYPIRFICGRVFEKYISNLHPNIDFVPALGNDDKMSEEDIKTWLSLPSGEERELFAMKRVLIDAMSEQHETIQAEAQKFRDEFGDGKPMIALFDQTATGHFPILFGAPGIRPDANVGISLAPLTIDSNDTFPFRSGKVPHAGSDARAVHWAAYQERDRNPFSIELEGAFVDKLREMGCTRDTAYPSLQQAMNSEPDYLMTLGIPEFEFPRSDIRNDIRYFGAFKKVGKGSTSEGKPALPTWWDDIAKAKQDGKKILAVSQGTVSMDPNEMVLPTLDALKDRDDILLIATFVSSEPEDVPGLVVPENTRVAKFVPYDELLPLVDILISNGGYGAVQHALRLGIPMVVSGVSEDKATTNSIVQWSGVGIDLGSQSPGAEKIKDAVTKMLEDNSYKTKAKTFSKEYEKYDVGKTFDKVIQDAYRDWRKKKAGAKSEL